MPTDDQSTQDSDAIAHQNLQDGQNAQAHSDQSFDARRAFDATNKRVNEIAEKLKDFDPSVLAKLAEQVGSVEETSGKTVEAKEPSVQDVVKAELWRSQNADRIEKSSEAFEKYRKMGYHEEHALRLAEQDQGIMVDTSEQKRQQTVSSANSSVDRDVKPEMPESLKGIMTPEEFAKVADKASKVKIIR